MLRGTVLAAIAIKRTEIVSPPINAKIRNIWLLIKTPRQSAIAIDRINIVMMQATFSDLCTIPVS